MLDPEWVYKDGYIPFAEIGSDVFFTVSPSKLHLFVADADAINEITTRRNDFPKPLALYARLDIFGRNVVTTEGDTWRMHRRVTAPSFCERNNKLVFAEALHHTKAMLKLWTGPDGKGNRTVAEPDTDIMRFALYVISRAGFDLRVLWPHEEEDKAAAETETSLQFGTVPAPGHSMSYRDALSILLHNILLTQAIPPHVLSKTSTFVCYFSGVDCLDQSNLRSNSRRRSVLPLQSGFSTLRNFTHPKRPKWRLERRTKGWICSLPSLMEVESLTHPPRAIRKWMNPNLSGTPSSF